MSQQQNKRTAFGAAAVVVVMLGMAYAAVPLYDLFCRVTGYGGTPQTADAAPAHIASERTILIRFDANTQRDLPWVFEAPKQRFHLRIGESGLAFFTAENKSARPVTGVATFNVTPEKAAIYFSKIDCFCFSEQTLAPGESVDMPVSFFIDPEILTDTHANDVTEITLSYSFFESPKQAKQDKKDIPQG